MEKEFYKMKDIYAKCNDIINIENFSIVTDKNFI